MTKIIFIIFILLQILFIVNAQITNEKKLIFVTVLHRHGDRAPLQPFPNDLYSNISYWPNGWGQLTDKGIQQMYELGQWLRKRYDNFLPEKYFSKDIYVISSDTDRTIMSASAVMSALYYPKTTNPIPIHTIPLKHDNVISVHKQCPRHTFEFNKLLESDDFKSEITKMSPVIDYVFKSINTTYDTVALRRRNFLLITDNLLIQSLNDFELPNWSKDVFPNPMQEYFIYLYRLRSYNIQMQRIRAGVLLNEIVGRFYEKINKRLSPDRQMWVYSVHDITIFDIFMVIGYNNPEDVRPIYGSSLIFELYKQNEKYYVQLLYKKGDIDQPLLLSISDCDEYCPLDETEELLKPYLTTPDEWELECNDIPKRKEADTFPIGTVLFITFLILLTSIVLSMCCFRRFKLERL